MLTYQFVFDVQITFHFPISVIIDCHHFSPSVEFSIVIQIRHARRPLILCLRVENQTEEDTTKNGRMKI